MRIALLQTNPTVGDVRGNLLKIKTQIEHLRDFADLFVTPELALVGYPTRDLLSLKSVLDDEAQALSELAVLSAELKIGILVGHSEKNSGHGAPLFNAATLFDLGHRIGHVHKRRIPEYDIFDEARFFAGATAAQPVLSFRGIKLGIAICEDAWNSTSAFGIRDIRRYPDLAGSFADADLLVNLSASPFNFGKRQAREDLFCATAARQSKPLIYVTCCGGQDDIIFDGASFAAQADGEICARAKAFATDDMIVELRDGRLSAPISAEPLTPWQSLENALVLGLRDFVGKCGAKKVLLGLSGGIDSALCAALAVRALGPDHVLGVSLPSALTSELSKTEARDVAQRLGIEFREIPISEAVEVNRRALGLEARGLAFENLQSRSRGLLLMGIANAENRLLLATANKSEFAMGYSTLYGDMCGALCPLGDLYKTEVFGLAHHLGGQAETTGQRAPISHETLRRPPTAELAEGQTDSDSLPSYEILDGVLFELIENQGQTIFKEESWNALLGAKHSVASLRRRMAAQEFKRYQAAPILRVHQRAFGSGWRMPIAKGLP